MVKLSPDHVPISIDPEAEHFRWGPIDGYATNIMGWYALCELTPARYHVTWPEHLVLFQNGKMLFLLDWNALLRSSTEVFPQWILNSDQQAILWNDWQQALAELTSFQEQLEHDQIFNGDRETIGREFGEWWNRWKNFWMVGLVPELASWGGEQRLKNALTRHQLSPEQSLHALEILSRPTELSFFREADRQLLKLANEKNFDQELRRFTEQHHWLHNSYGQIQRLTVEDFRLQFEQLRKQAPEDPIRDIDEGIERATREREALFRQLQFSETERAVARGVDRCITWQDQRKKYVWMGLSILDQFLQGLARTTGFNIEDLNWCAEEELDQLFRGASLDPSSFSTERSTSVLHYVPIDSSSYHLSWRTQDAARDVIAAFWQPKIAGSNTVAGMVVSRGQGSVEGVVRIIRSPNEQENFQDGDILVAPMTSPDFVTVMRRAAAIVTDEGGLTSHAAIVSRELQIPCIVGTRSATTVFQNGDRVRVDVDRGRVEKISDD
jgi:phosphohistidine swiveling domain-containing protein